MSNIRARATIDAQWRGGNETREAGRDLKGVGESATSTERGFAGLTKGVGLAVAGFSAAAGAISALGRGFVEVTALAAEQQRVEAQLAATLESTGHAAGLSAGQLTAMASELQNVSTFGDEAIIASQSLLLTFTKIGGDVFPRAQAAILDTATAMGTDLKAASLQVGKALNDPIAGVSALAESGIQFTDAQKDMIKALVETGDVAGAQTIILKELETQFGGSAEAAAAAGAGPFTQFQNILGDVGEAIGSQLLPGLTEIANEAGPAVLAAMQELSPEIESIGAGMGEAADAIVPLLQNMRQVVQVGRNVSRVLKGVATLGFSELIPWIQRGTDSWRDNNRAMFDAQTNARRARMGLEPLVSVDVEGWANEGAQGIEQVNTGVTELTQTADETTESVSMLTEEIIRLRAGSVESAAATDRMAESHEQFAPAANAATTSIEEEINALDGLFEGFEKINTSISGGFITALDQTDGKMTTLQDATADLDGFILNLAASSGATAGEMALLAAATGDYSQTAIDAAVKQIEFEIRLETIRQRFADGSISVHQMRDAVQDLVNTMNGLQDKTVNVTVNTTHNGQQVNNSQTTNGSGLQEFGDGELPPGRAIGGFVGANQSVMVGENGPEMFTPVNAGFIRDNETVFGGQNQNNGPRTVNHNTFVGLEATALFAASLEQDAELQTVVG